MAPLTTAVATAQLPSVFVDVGSRTQGFGVPATGYAAAAPAGGVWNALDADVLTERVNVSPPLLDATGAPTAVTLTLDGLTTGGYYQVNYGLSVATGDDHALLDDLAYNWAASQMRFDGLPAGTYDVYLYAMAPDIPYAQTSVSVVSSADPLQVVGGMYSGVFVQGVTHSLHTASVSAGEPLVIDIDVVTFSDAIAGVQVVPESSTNIGVNYCGPANVNTTGNPAQIVGSGSVTTASNDVSLLCLNMPQQAFGMFLVSSSVGFVANPGGSEGNLCLGGAIGRYVGPGQIQNSGQAGAISLAIDLTSVPQPSSTVAVQAGETWYWQAWFRDSTTGGAPTSNTSDGLQIDFQ
ncbi:MAG: hypothetical protein AAGG01_02820 [Planctomycetota bacterium]